MIYAVIAAGGIGSRMGNVEKPKQYLTLSDKPIIVHTCEKFYSNEQIEKTLILCPQDWVQYTQQIIDTFFPSTDKIKVLSGGKTRNDTLMNAIDYIEKTHGLTDDTIVVTHDAVRPFVSKQIIDENIKAAIEFGATGTFVPSTDTIVKSENGEIIDSVPDRSKLFNAQTPQCFNAKLLKKFYNELSEEQKVILTDACKIFSINSHDVHMVQGIAQNIKITYAYDLKVAKILFEEGF